MEDTLMIRIAQGDGGSFEELYRLWSRRVMSYAYKALRDLHEAQDVVQETFLQIYRAAPAYRAEGKFAAFAFRIAANQIRQRFRTSRPVGTLADAEDDSSQRTPEALTYAPEDGLLDKIDIDMALASLPERQRDALVMAAEGLSYAEAAERMEITPAAFAQLVLRARRALRIRFGEKAGDLQ